MLFVAIASVVAVLSIARCALSASPEVPRQALPKRSWSELPSAVHRHTFLGRLFWTTFLMFTRARQEPWITAVAASGALGLVLYYLRARRPSPANTANPQPEREKPSETSTTDFVAEDMSAEDRAYHERFMREAISMVSRSACLLHFCCTVSFHAN